MQDLSDDDRKTILGEVLLDELKIIREYLEDVPVIKQKVTKLEADVEELKADMKVVKNILAKHDTKLDNHETALQNSKQAACRPRYGVYVIILTQQEAAMGLLFRIIFGSYFSFGGSQLHSSGLVHFMWSPFMQASQSQPQDARGLSSSSM